MTEGEAGRSAGCGQATALLYAEDSYLTEFTATAIRSGPGYVVLDRTAFYPASGGQPSDIGLLSCASKTVRVLKVLKRDRDIFHYIDGPLPEGVVVHGVLDWDARFFNMRRHSAEHLLSGLFELAGAGPKVYSDMTRLEFKPSDLTEDRVRRVKAEFNRAVGIDIPIRIYYASRSEVDVEADERKRAFLEKIPRSVERLRMVEIPGYDRTFCFGTHVRSTGEIGRLSKLELVKGRRRREVLFFELE